MKKTVFLVAALAIATCMIFTACNFGLSEGEKVSFEYKENDIRQNLRDLADAQGFCITYSVVDDKKVDENNASSISETEKFDLVYGAFHDVYYYKNDAKECVFDLSSDLGFSVFERSLDGESWSREYTLYTSTVTKQTAEAEVEKTAEDFFELATQHLGFDGSNMVIGSATIAGRECGSYSFSIKVFGVGVSYHTYVDNATGVCLGINCDVTAIVQDEDLDVYECTDFKTSYTLLVPENYVDAIVGPNGNGKTDPEGEGEGQNVSEGEGEGQTDPTSEGEGATEPEGDAGEAEPEGDNDDGEGSGTEPEEGEGGSGSEGGIGTLPGKERFNGKGSGNDEDEGGALEPLRPKGRL